jgi:hypothetical protein
MEGLQEVVWAANWVSWAHRQVGGSSSRLDPFVGDGREPGRWGPRGTCRMDLPGPTTSVGTRTDYSVGPWDYPTCAARNLMA